MLPSSSSEKLKFKKLLQQSCISILEKRITVSREAMNEAQQAANSEGKSSAGDKYETSRAMGQLDRDMNAKQLEEANRDLAFINSLSVTSLFDSVISGSVVVCKQISFFLSLGLGAIFIGDQQIILLSSSAPIARLLEGKKTGDTFIFNRNKTEILDVF